MYIAGVPTVEFESRNVYRWCARCRIRVQERILLTRLLRNVSPGMYIVGAPTVEFKSRDVYRWCAHCRIRVQECILFVCPS